MNLRTLVLVGILTYLPPVQAFGAAPDDSACTLPSWYGDMPQWLADTADVRRSVGKHDDRIRSAFSTAIDELAPKRRRSAAARKICRKVARGSALAML
jgi:hypothetical protein